MWIGLVDWGSPQKRESHWAPWRTLIENAERGVTMVTMEQNCTMVHVSSDILKEYGDIVDTHKDSIMIS